MLRRCRFSWAPAFSPLYMPALSPSMERGTLVKWNTKIGDLIAQGTSICSIQTDKAVVSFDHQMDDGYLAATYAQEGDTVEVAKLIGLLVEEAADVAKASEYTPDPAALPGAAPAAAPPAAVPVPHVSSPPKTPQDVAPLYGSVNSAVQASGPAVLRIAHAVGFDALKSITPTGKNGRYTKSDVMHLSPKEAALVQPTTPATKSASATAGTVLGPILFSTIRPTPVQNFKVSDKTTLAYLFSKKVSSKSKAMKN